MGIFYLYDYANKIELLSILVSVLLMWNTTTTATLILKIV